MFTREGKTRRKGINMDYIAEVKKIMEEYYGITGLKSYMVRDEAEINSASEKNYFCKCLKVSSSALKACEECTKETYGNALEIDRECIYSCHAGLIKWAVPVKVDNFHCVIVSEGILNQKQLDDSELWGNYLSKQYDLDKKKLLDNFRVIKTMNEGQMKSSIRLLKDLISYHFQLQQD